MRLNLSSLSDSESKSNAQEDGIEAKNGKEEGWAGEVLCEIKFFIFVKLNNKQRPKKKTKSHCSSMQKIQ